MTATDIPEGFAPFPLDDSFNDVFAPLYIAMDEDGPRIALKVERHHLNPMGICHGAVYMALFDIAFACIIGHSLGKFTGTPTININIDYLSASREGEWLFTNVQCLKTTNSVGFAQGVIRCGDELKASGSGVFKLPADLAAAKGYSP